MQAANLPTTQADSFQLLNCVNTDFATALSTLRQILPSVITDLDSSTTSAAYNAFFGDLSYAPYVREILTNSTNGASVSPIPGLKSSSPVFVCVNDTAQVVGTFESPIRKEPVKQDFYNVCKGTHEEPGAVAYHLQWTPYIVICPRFFKRAPVPHISTALCLKIKPHVNRFVGDGQTLAFYQICTILHELVHYYSYSTKQDSVDQYFVNSCLTLEPDLAILNPASYVYYAASKYKTSSLSCFHHYPYIY